VQDTTDKPDTAPKRLGKSDRFGRTPAPRCQQNAGARPPRRI